MTVLTSPTLLPLSPTTNPPPKKKKKREKNQINLRHDDTTQRHGYKCNSLLSSNWKKVAVHQLHRHRVALLHCWRWYFWFGTTEGCSVLPQAHKLKCFKVGRRSQLNPTRFVVSWWKHPVCIMFTMVRGHQPVWLKHPKNTVHTPIQRHTHIIIIHDALFPFWSDCNNYTLLSFVNKNKAKNLEG